jgi:hypothetical protein
MKLRIRAGHVPLPQRDLDEQQTRALEVWAILQRVPQLDQRMAVVACLYLLLSAFDTRFGTDEVVTASDRQTGREQQGDGDMATGCTH